MQQLQNKLPQLDARLLTAAGYVRRDSCAADIGCDHGKLSLHLASNGICKKVIACDMRQKPLAKARWAVSLYGLDDLIECRLGDGLSVVSPSEADDIIIAGMSGVTISEIISAAPLFYTKGRRFILVPATKPELLRRFLFENGFSIIAETPVEVSRYCYAVICAEYTGEKRESTAFEEYVGLCNDGSAAAHKYFAKVLHRLEKQGDTALAAEVKACLI